MKDMKEDFKFTNIEAALIVGIIGCLLLATWELGNLMVTECLVDWVIMDPFTNKRIILYSIAFLMAIGSILISIKTINKEQRFIYTLNRAILWYGSLLLISTISIFVFDCLPEVAAGFIGATLFALAIYFLQKKYFNKERVTRNRIRKGLCFECGHPIQRSDSFCNHCGTSLEKTCPRCSLHNLVYDNFCNKCGETLK